MNLKESVGEVPAVEEAHAAVLAAAERHEEAKAERREAEAAVEAAEEALDAAVEAGDPDGQVPKLTKAVQDARAEVEVAGNVAQAAERAVQGAIRTRARARLDAIDETWDGADVEELRDRFVEALSALSAAVDEVDALLEERKALTDLSRHLVGDRLDGAGTVPGLGLPDALRVARYRAGAEPFRAWASDILSDVEEEE